MAERPEINDRFWMISTRSLTSSTCNMDLDSPEFRVHRLDCRGRLTPTTLDEYLGALTPERQVVVYVHGNRMASNQIVNRSFSVYRKIANCVENRPVDWVIWSWPSSKQGILVHDARRKAARTDAQGLYLGWLLQRQVKQTESTKMIGFSFGSRVITDCIHLLVAPSAIRQVHRPPEQPLMSAWCPQSIPTGCLKKATMPRRRKTSTILRCCTIDAMPY